ncbi:MAG: hypothetical protein WCO69_02785 [Candidatus Omnitrophota bacterium]
MVKLMLAVVILAGGVFCGLRLASQKLLWNDELFTQVETIDRLSTRTILEARFPEGNLSPLFYLGQKFICRLADYRLPVAWRGEFCVYEPRGQVLLRILPVVCMSLAVALIFLYFSWRESVGFGLLSAAVTLSGFSIWAFLPEARPYALWVLLCALQGMLFMEILGPQKENSARRIWVWLAVVNGLLSLTIFFAALPIVAVSAVLLVRDRTRYWRWCVPVTVIPLAVCVLYYVLSKRTYPNLSQEPASVLLMLKGGLTMVFSGALWAQRDLILTNVPPFWFYFIAAGSLASAACRVPAGTAGMAGSKAVVDGLLAAFLLMLGMALAVIVWFLGWKASGNFGVAERYFIFLTPAALLLIVALIRHGWYLTENDRWGRLIVIVGTGSMIALSSLWTYVHLMKWGPFWSV